jgi:hypothetical protein
MTGAHRRCSHRHRALDGQRPGSLSACVGWRPSILVPLHAWAPWLGLTVAARRIKAGDRR